MRCTYMMDFHQSMVQMYTPIFSMSSAWHLRNACNGIVVVWQLVAVSVDQQGDTAHSVNIIHYQCCGSVHMHGNAGSHRINDKLPSAVMVSGVASGE